MKEYPLRRLIVSLLVLVCLVGCVSTPIVEYGDPRATETVDTGFGSTDLQLIAAQMTESLLASSVLGHGQPAIAVLRVKNNTSEHIDTRSITNKIRTTMLKSGKARFVAAEYRNQILDEVSYQHSGPVSNDEMIAYGRQVGAEYLLAGDISSITKNNARVRDVYYGVHLFLISVETGLIEWSEEAEIRKASTRRLVGY